jgi:hypothetical protein
MSFLNGIWQLLMDLTPAVLDGFVKLIDWVCKMYKAFAASFWILLSVLWFGLVYIYDGLNWVADHFQTINALVSGQTAIVGDQIPPALAEGFEVANAFLPLTEFFGVVTFAFSIWSICLIVRAVKSWIPTVSG